MDSPIVTADSARIVGQIKVGEGDHLAQGTVIRSVDGAVWVDGRTLILENSVVIGNPKMNVRIGQNVVFGHRCLVVGAQIGDLCEIGNGSIMMPGAVIGAECILGEGTLIAEGQLIAEQSVVVGRPGRVVRKTSPEDRAKILELRGGNISLEPQSWYELTSQVSAGAKMGKLYSYKDKIPQISKTAILFDSAEVTGDVHIGEDAIIGAGVKIIGDSHGPVRIGAKVQILENSVLHLLPHNELIIEDEVIIGPGAMIHGCHIGRGTIIEPGAQVCDFSRIGQNCIVRAGSLVKQKSVFQDNVVVEGFPARETGKLVSAPPVPAWAFDRNTLPKLIQG